MADNLSKRGRALVKDMSPLMHADFRTRDNLFHPQRNPQGHINLGTAETHLINTEVLQLLGAVQSRLQLQPGHIHYDYFHGSDAFRQAIAAHWQPVLFAQSGRALTRNNIVVGAGCSLALEMLATTLGDPGDVFLIPAPYYSGFVDDIHDRAGIMPVGVHCGPNLSRNAFEQAYREQAKLGNRVAAVLFSSPNNPVGTVYEPESVRELIDFCVDKNIDLISDEIYAQTVHDPQAHFRSALDLVPDGYRTHVHATSSFAKDFALSGLRTGFAVSFDEDLLKGMRGLAYYSAVSTHTQAVLTELLQAPELPRLLQRNREQLGAACRHMEQLLAGMGIQTLPAQGGIFLFADFRPLLREPSFEAEFALWERIHTELRVNISPGQLFDARDPGWFRICYAHPAAVVDEVGKRLGKLS